MIWLVTVFSLELLKLVPRRLFVTKIDTPLNIDKRAGVAAAFDVIAEFQRAAMRMLVVIRPDLKARSLSFHSSLRILASRHSQLGQTVRREQRIAATVTIDRQCGWFFR